VKTVNFILSIYLVVLACLPCADIEVNSAAHDSIAHQSEQDDHSHDKDSDFCAPFCTCNCCGLQIASYFQITNIEIALVSILIETKQPVYKSIFASNYFGSIWQPPQIA
jgi:hypothetical protein